MAMLKSKAEIENYDKKAELLRRNGWDTLWHDDNWVKDEWKKDPKMNIDWAGLETDKAFAKLQLQTDMLGS